jgi:hypothetical protein
VDPPRAFDVVSTLAVPTLRHSSNPMPLSPGSGIPPLAQVTAPPNLSPGSSAFMSPVVVGGSPSPSSASLSGELHKPMTYIQSDMNGILPPPVRGDGSRPKLTPYALPITVGALTITPQSDGVAVGSYGVVKPGGVITLVNGAVVSLDINSRLIITDSHAATTTQVFQLARDGSVLGIYAPYSTGSGDDYRGSLVFTAKSGKPMTAIANGDGSYAIDTVLLKPKGDALTYADGTFMTVNEAGSLVVGGKTMSLSAEASFSSPKSLLEDDRESVTTPNDNFPPDRAPRSSNEPQPTKTKKNTASSQAPVTWLLLVMFGFELAVEFFTR